MTSVISVDKKILHLSIFYVDNKNEWNSIMDFVDRIDSVLKEKNIKRAAMCEAVGIDSSIMSVWKKRGTIPAADVAIRIADFLSVSIIWLVTGKAEVVQENFNLSEDEQIIIKMYRYNSNEEKSAIFYQLFINIKNTCPDVSFISYLTESMKKNNYIG